MRVLILTQHFWPETFRINDLARALADAGGEVTVLTGKPNYPAGRVFDGYRAWGMVAESYGDIHVARVPLIPRGRGGALRLAGNYLSFLGAATLLAPWALFGRRVDAILVYATSPLLQALAAIPLKLIKRAPLVVWVQDLWPESLAATGYIRNRAALKVVEWLVRLVYWSADRILIQSEAFRAPVARLADPRKLHYFPNPADAVLPSAVTAASGGPAEALRADVFSVVFAGNLGTAQSLETILDAAEAIGGRPDIRFVIVGDGSQAAWMRQQVVERRLANVDLLGRHPVEAMPALFAKASALLVTLRNEEIFSLTVPSKVQAYLAAGRPIIACLNGEGGRIVEDAGAGVVCSAGDARALADAVVRLADMDPAVRRRMGEAGRHYCNDHFEVGRLAERLLADLRQLARRTA